MALDTGGASRGHVHAQYTHDTAAWASVPLSGGVHRRSPTEPPHACRQRALNMARAAPVTVMQNNTQHNTPPGIVYKRPAAAPSTPVATPAADGVRPSQQRHVVACHPNAT